MKIDYGESYEKVRVRKNYARVSGSKKNELIDECRLDDLGTMDDIAIWNLKSVHACLGVLEKCLGDRIDRPSAHDDFFERSLIIALLLRARINAIVEEFRDLDGTDDYCANGVTCMALPDMVELSKRVLALACSRCGTTIDGLKSRILLHGLLKACVEERLRLTKPDLEDIKPEKLQKMILFFPDGAGTV